MRELQIDSRTMTITSGKKKFLTFPGATFMSPSHDACSLAVTGRPRNIRWMSNLHFGKRKSYSSQQLAKQGSGPTWKVLVALKKKKDVSGEIITLWNVPT